MDLRPGYRELAPPPALRGALACLWVRVAGPQDPPVRILPDACADLVWRPGSGVAVAGPDTGPVLWDAEPGAVVVGARFVPGAGGPALGLPLSELRDQRVALEELVPRLARDLHGELEPDDALDRLGAAAAGLVRRAPPDAAVRAAVRRLCDPRAQISTLAADLGFSERQLRRRCHAGVGYGPKVLHRALRFRRFLAAVDAAGDRPDLARIAAEVGYADQAHLSRDCARLSGLSPSRLARERAVSR